MKSVPFFFEIERARGMVADLDEAIWKYQEMLVGIKVDMDYLKEEISSKETGSVEEEAIVGANIGVFETETGPLFDQRQKVFL